MSNTNPVTYNEACEFFRRLGYTEELTWRDSHGNSEAKFFQSPREAGFGSQPQIMVVDYTFPRFGKPGDLQVYQEVNPRGDFRAARLFDRDSALLLNTSISVCATSKTEKFFKGGSIIYITSVVGHGKWLNREPIHGKISQTDKLTDEEKKKVIDYIKRNW